MLVTVQAVMVQAMAVPAAFHDPNGQGRHPPVP